MDHTPENDENRLKIGLGDVTSLIKHYIAGYEPDFTSKEVSRLGNSKTYFGYNKVRYYSDDNSENILGNKFKTARIILDLGSGQGDSVNSILKFTPSIQYIYTVDSEFSSIQLNSDIPNKHFKEDIIHFLGYNSIGADIIILRGVPTHNLNFQDYVNLYKNTSPEGILLEFGDTLLNEEIMKESGFISILSVETRTKWGDVYYDRIWQKSF